MKVEPSLVDCVIYHANCTDGFGSAYSAWKLLGNRAEYHACSHGQKPPDVKGKTVAILDFSFNNKTTKKMIKDAKALIVIDHHKSAVVELHDIANTIFDMKSRKAQEQIPSVQGLNKSFFCGAYNGYGFHEDGINSSLAVVKKINEIKSL